MPVTKFKTKTQQLKAAERKSHAWLEKSPVCTKIVDLDLNLQYMSTSGVESLRISDITAYYGKPYPLEFYPQSFRDQMSKSIKCARDTKEIVEQEAAVVDIAGNEVWFHSTIVPVYDDSNQLEYFMIVSIDTTERKFAEKKLHQLNDELETLVTSRTLKLEEANKQLKITSETDFLTKISNRRFYERRISENIATAKRNKTFLSLLMIDIDDFKKYNDKYGHDIGDIALHRIAESIAKSLPRETDLVSRFGGEEFIVLFPDTDIKTAFTLAEKIRMNVKDLELKNSEADTSLLTVSIGIEAQKGNKLNKNDLLKHADIALYVAKGNGKNCCHIFTG